jgi:hypothetical protein
MEDHVGAPEQGSRSRQDPGGDLVHVIIHGEVFIVNPISRDQVPSRWFCSPLVLLLPQSILKIDCIGCSCSRGG